MPPRRRNLDRFTDAKRAEAVRVAREKMGARLGLDSSKARQLDDVLLDVLDAAVGVLIRGGPPPDVIVLDAAPNAHNDLSGEVTSSILLFDPDEPGIAGHRTIKIVTRPEHALAWATQMAMSAGYAWQVRADAWRRGDCATCSNVRMIDDPDVPGRHSAIHCPDCNPGPNPDAFPHPHTSPFAPKPVETRRDDSTS